MKKILLLVLLASAVSARAQTLKEALYSGKLKTDTGTVIRKGEDLTSKIDTATKKPVEPEKAKITAFAQDSSITGPVIQNDPAPVPGAAPKDNAVASRDNNKIWKDYMDEFIGTLRTEVLPSKRIKDGIYSVLIEYEIDTDGQVTVNSVSSSPESSFLEQQVKERLIFTAPPMNPLLGATGKPRKAVKKYTFTLSK